MLYGVENIPEDVSFLQLDSIILCSITYLEFDCDGFLLITFDDEIKEPSCGYFEYDKEENELHISISHTLRGEEMVRTIMHELVHARQILSGLYVPNMGNTPGKWKGVECSGDYMDLPWEIEAYALEEQMYFEYSRTI